MKPHLTALGPDDTPPTGQGPAPGLIARRSSRRIQFRPWVWEVLALASLAALAWALYGFLLRDDLFIYGDHPGQFMRFWYPARVSQRLLGWNPNWYAGYPELQFYLPGYVLFGWALDVLTLSRLSAFAVYQLVLFVAGALPGASVYALVRRVSGSRWAGLAAGCLALIFPVMWGGLEAVFVGMVSWRLAFGMMPLVMLAGWRALHSPQPTRDWLFTALALAAVALMHPFQALAPVLFLALCAAGRSRRDLGRNWATLAATVLLALGLIAFWLAPLVAHAGYATPLLRATLDETAAWLTSRTVLLYLGAAALVPFLLLVRRDRALSTLAGAMAGMAGLSVALILLDHLVLMPQWGVHSLDPMGFSPGIYLALVVLAGLGLAGIPEWSARVAPARWKRLSSAAGVGLACLAVCLLSQPTVAAVLPQRSRGAFLEQARSQFPLDATWERLADGEGRILFTSFWLHLDDMPTTLKSLTPYFARRSTIGGTYSHWSPVARYLWVGTSQVSLLPGRVEMLDDVSLAGRPWEEWTDAEFLALCQQLGVTTVVSTWDDFRARTFLDAAPHFHSTYSNDLFVVYDVLQPEPSMVAAEGAAAKAVVVEPDAMDIRVAGAEAGSRLLVKVTQYPLWQVRIGETSLQHEANAMGLMTVRLPAGSYDLQVRYELGRVEKLGGLISLGTAALWLACLALTFHNPQHP